MSGTLSIGSTLVAKKGQPLENYRSRTKQLAAWLLESRDALREKYRSVKVELKRLKVRVADVTKSRDSWRQRTEASNQQVLALQAEVKRLTAAVELADSKKK